MLGNRPLRHSWLLVLCCFFGWTAAAQSGIPGRATVARGGALAGTVYDEIGRTVPGVTVQARRQGTRGTYTAESNGEGVYRFVDLPPGEYVVTPQVGVRFKSAAEAAIAVRAAQLQTLDLKVVMADAKPLPPAGLSGIPGLGITEAVADAADSSPYPGYRSPQPENTEVAEAAAEPIPSEDENFAPETDRWKVRMPPWQRYNKTGEIPYVKSHWYDPFNRNRLKGDYPIFGQRWFLNFTGTSLSVVDPRRLPVPSNLGAERPGSNQFFGRGEQVDLQQTFRLSFDLFHGDTAFRPSDFRLQFTPAFNLNYLQTRERGLVNVDVLKGTNRFDGHIGLQEGFAEYKLKDLSPNFDFVSIRAGIQGFSSDFRGFIFSDEQPGIRIFGNLRSNRINYNLAYFYFLEKDTNSGLNTFDSRHQQVWVANVYVQDFLTKGYTTEFSFHFNRDDPSLHYDENGFLVRPAPIGRVVLENGIPNLHGIHAYYIGWAGNGHIRRLNISHAFYQALGHDTFNPIAGRPVDINAQLGALELSVDKDWLRFRASLFYASGDGDGRVGMARSGTARGFDSIVDRDVFAGTDFSFFNREGIRLTGTGVLLTPAFSLLPDLRSNKEEGQANFVNPGIRVYNVGVDADLTPKLRSFLNASYLQFDRTQQLEAVLFQSPIKRSIGPEFGVGFSYRPPLTENIVLVSGVSTLIPGTSLRQIYNSRVLLSGFTALRFQF